MVGCGKPPEDGYLENRFLRASIQTAVVTTIHIRKISTSGRILGAKRRLPHLSVDARTPGRLHCCRLKQNCRLYNNI